MNTQISFAEMAERGKEILKSQGPITYEKAKEQVERLRKGSYLRRMKGEFKYKQQYMMQTIVNGEYVDTGDVWSKGADDRYTCPTRPGIINQFEVEVGLRTGLLRVMENDFNLGIVP